MKGLTRLIIVVMTNQDMPFGINISVGKFTLANGICSNHTKCICLVTFAIEISASVTPTIGLQCNLTCTVSGAELFDSTVTYQWFKDGTIISDVNESTLILQSSQTDAGEYTCKADVSSEYLIPSFTSNVSNTYRLCFALGKLKIASHDHTYVWLFL